MSGNEVRGAGDTVVESRVVYPGRLIRLRLDKVRTAKGHLVDREVVEHPGAVAVVALDDAGRVVLVRQYRLPVEHATLEVPAGTLGRGEDPADCAKRELREETGFDADTWWALPRIHPSPGYCNESIWLFLATGLRETTEHAEQDADEDISLEWLPLDEAVARCGTGEIADGKTMVALLLAARERAGG